MALTRLENVGFELGTDVPGFWVGRPSASGSTTWDSEHPRTGKRSAKVHNAEPSESSWQQSAMIAVEPRSIYELSGWVRTEGVSVPTGAAEQGANLDVIGPNTMHLADGLVGDNDWTRLRRTFNTLDAEQIIVRVGLGIGGRATGSAWFDDLALTKIEPDGDTTWNIQVLIYGSTDFSFTDPGGIQRHAVGDMSDDEKATAESRARTFVEEDIPQLTSGMVEPSVTVTHIAEPLSHLSSVNAGFSPAHDDVATDVDPAADSVIVIWDPRTIDVNSGAVLWIGAAAGLSYWRGTGQLYVAMIIEAASQYPHGNVFKHEWGHSIVSYFHALGVAPLPAVEVHAESDDYVNCRTGEPYVWVDELYGAPIPDSIYNNSSGFTHDYYSGTIATAEQPDRCIGITPEAWSYGGPGPSALFTRSPSLQGS